MYSYQVAGSRWKKKLLPIENLGKVREINDFRGGRPRGEQKKPLNLGKWKIFWRSRFQSRQKHQQVDCWVNIIDEEEQ